MNDINSQINGAKFSPKNLALSLLFGTSIFPIMAILAIILNIPILASLGTDFIPMAPSTAISFLILIMLSVINLMSSNNSINKKLTIISCSMVATFSIWTFFSLISGKFPAPDDYYIPTITSLGNNQMWKMASATAFLFLLLSISMMFSVIDIKRISRLGSISSALVILIAFIFIVGYALGVPLFYGSQTMPMALPTAISFLLLGMANIILLGIKNKWIKQRFNNYKDITIKNQLMLGLSAMSGFVIILGLVSYSQTYKIHRQTEMLYEHPLMVRRALGALSADILQMRIHMRGLPLANDAQEIQETIKEVAIYDADTKFQLDTLYSRFLGPRAYIDSVQKTLIEYRANREETIRYLRLGDMAEVIARLHPKGVAGLQIERIFAKIKIIDEFARNKGNELYATSKNSYYSLILQLIFLVAIILLLTLIINSILLRNIRKPLNELQSITARFHSGDLSARSSYKYNNEFGVLSNSYNALADSIQSNFELNEKVVTLSTLMLSEDNAETFFKETLTALALFTKSQIAAVYLLSEDKTTYEHFESIGSSSTIKQSFSAIDLDGEFGTVISSGKLNHVMNIPEDTRFVFKTSSFDIIPREILTIPIISAKEIIAIISLTSIKEYSESSLQLVDEIIDTLSARIAGILAYSKVKEYSEKLGQQNAELEAQKNELSSQSAELTEQNTELEMQKNQLNEVSKLKTNFLSNMSHELRTPLNSVIALSGVLNRRLAKQIPDEEYSYLEVIERNGKHLLSLINDILDISRIEAGREEIEITKFNINELIASTASMIMPQAQEKSIELIHSNPNTEILISSDIHKVQHILQNLIGNAIKFTERGQVKVSVEFNNNKANISVSDTGIGIAEQNLEHIFDEFRQADGSTSRRFGGTGLGLAIAKKYTELLGGSISVDSKLGVGTTFTFDIPNIKTNNSLKTIEISHPSLHSNTKLIQESPHADLGKTILLVEDSEPAIIQIRDFLEQSGYQIIVARDGGEALELLSKNIPDAMVLDLMMPGIDGFELLATLRNADITANIPVLILTAKHITQDELKFLKRNNVHQLIQKGDVNRIELLNSVYSMIFPIKNAVIKPSISLQIIEGKPSVLVVEDNPDNMLTVRALLSENYEIIEATDATEGIELAKTKLPNLILMDIALPGMDGIGAFRIIRNTPQLQHIPVVALTASAMTTDRESILAHGFDGYIAKPIDDKLFFKTLKMVIYGTQEN